MNIFPVNPYQVLDRSKKLKFGDRIEFYYNGQLCSGIVWEVVEEWREGTNKVSITNALKQLQLFGFLKGDFDELYN